MPHLLLTFGDLILNKAFEIFLVWANFKNSKYKIFF